MAIKLKKDGILQTNFLTRREEKTGNVKTVISPNKFQVGLATDTSFHPGMCVYGQSIFYQGISGSLTKLSDGTSYLVAGSNVTIVTGTNGSITISSTGGSGSPGGSDTEVQFNDAGVFGGDSDFTYNKTSNTLTVTGTINATTGLSGSLTKLTDGTSYLIAGSNVTVTTGTNGSVTISSTGGGGTPGGSNTDVQFNDGGSFGGDSDFTYDKTLNELTLSGTLKQLTGSFYSTNYAGNVNLRAPFDLATELNFTLPEADGTKFQFMQTDSAGNLSFDFSDRVYFNVRNQSGADLQAGTPVYVIGYSAGNDRAVIAASSASVAATMPAVGILAQNLTNNSNGKAVAIGILEGVNTVSFSEGDSLYVGDGVLQNTKPTGFNDLIQNAAFVLESAANGTLNVKSPGRTNDVPNIVTAVGGFSGSLTTLTDGTSYLIAGTSVDISSQSNGPVTISTTNVTASYVSSSVIEGGTVGEILAVNGSGVSEFTHNIVDATNTISLATLARYAYDGSGIISLDWGGRQLKYSNGSNASDWSTDNLLQVTGATDITGTLNVVDSITTEISDSAIILDYGVGGASGGKHIYYEASGFNPPTFTNRSAGAKAVLYPNLGASSGDWAIGIENGHIWFSVPTGIAARGFKFYGGITEVAKINGNGALFIKENGTSPVPGSSFGSFWVKNDTPNVPYFTDDAGTDYQLAYVGAGVSDFFDSTTAGSIFTTGSAAFRGLESGVDSPSDKGTDVFFYVSGSGGTKDSATAGTALFGGDVTASGSLYLTNSGSIVMDSNTNIVWNNAGDQICRIRGNPNYTTLDIYFETDDDLLFYPGNALTVLLTEQGGITMNQQASAPNTVSSRGHFWVRNDSPNVPIFTDGAGTDYQLAYVGAAGGDSFFDSTTAGSIFTTGSTAIRGGESAVDSPSDKGTDVFFYVSGTIGSKDSATAGSTLLGGDVITSGTMYILSSTYISNDIGSGLLTPAPGTDFTPLMVEINSPSSLKYAAHFKNEGESAGAAIAVGFSNRSTQYTKKGAIAYERDSGFGRGDFHILQNSTADASDATLTDKVATFYNDGRGEVYGDWKAVSLTGSLTHLNDGSSYLVAGTNVTIVSNSNGSVTISSTASGGGGGSGFFDSTTAGSIFTTGSTAIRGGEPAVDSPSDKGTDVFFYVSGSEGSKDSATAGAALFGGDVVVSGTLYGSTFVERQPTAVVSGTVQHYGWAVNKMELINAQLFCYTTASQGSYDFTLTKDPEGTPINLLQTSSYDLKTLTPKTPTAATLTNTGSDLILQAGDVWMAQFEATSALIDAAGVYFLLNWKLI